jgi:hypothetical protein
MDFKFYKRIKKYEKLYKFYTKMIVKTCKKLYKVASSLFLIKILREINSKIDKQMALPHMSKISHN